MTDHEKIKNTFLDILYPRRCPVCHCIPEKRGQKICGGCKERLKPVAGPRCYKCSKPLRDPGREKLPQAVFMPACGRITRRAPAGRLGRKRLE